MLFFFFVWRSGLTRHFWSHDVFMSSSVAFQSECLPVAVCAGLRHDDAAAVLYGTDR